jgi:hypothetical protein
LAVGVGMNKEGEEIDEDANSADEPTGTIWND